MLNSSILLQVYIHFIPEHDRTKKQPGPTWQLMAHLEGFNPYLLPPV